MTKPYLSVIIPAYNEAANIARGVLDEVVSYLKTQKYSWELILVNDGSSDNTIVLLNKFATGKPQVKIIDNPHQGKAATVIAGALAAAGDVVLFSDMDQATPITETSKLLSHIESGNQIVIGSRANRKGAPLFRQILAYGMVIIRAVILRLPFKDTQCGFKAFTREAAQKIFSVMTMVHPPGPIKGPAVDPGFDVELLFLGRKMGFKIAEIPVAWHYQETRRVRFMYDAIAGFKGLLLVRYRSLLNIYKLS